MRALYWFQTHPRILTYLESLSHNGVDWAIYAGASVNLLAGSRQPRDLDIVVTPAGFEIAKRLAPTKVTPRSQDPLFRCGDGVVLDFPATGATFRLDGIDIDLMATGDARYGAHVYNPALSPLAIKNRLSMKVNGVKLYFSNPFDTMAIKSVLQRGAEHQKFDLQDIQALAQKCRLSSRYIARRTREINLDQRAWAFLMCADVKPIVMHSGNH